MEIEEVKPGSFVFIARNVIGASCCEDIIRRFEERSSDHKPGSVGQQAAKISSIKSTVDVRVSGIDYWSDIDQVLFTSLGLAISGFATKFPYFSANRFKDTGYHLQRYKTGDYYRWHVDSGPGSFSQRQLVAIWYLNTPASGGELEFAYQNLSITPEIGSLILFPPFWTHLHQSSPVQSGDKYIATTWVCFS